MAVILQKESDSMTRKTTIVRKKEPKWASAVDSATKRRKFKGKEYVLLSASKRRTDLKGMAEELLKRKQITNYRVIYNKVKYNLLYVRGPITKWSIF